MSDNIRDLRRFGPVPPNPTDEEKEADRKELVDLLIHMTAMARSGQLVSFVGCGFLNDQTYAAFIGPYGGDAMRMRGAIHFLADDFMLYLEAVPEPAS